jgi:murein DD-endopeptidase MepM/ murein hydrolase activator NlpD
MGAGVWQVLLGGVVLIGAASLGTMGGARLTPPVPNSGLGESAISALAGASDDLADPLARQIHVGSGDTLMGLLLQSGIDRQSAHDAIVALQTVYDPRRLRVGQELALRFAPDSTGYRAEAPLLLHSLVLPISYDREAQVERTTDGVFAAAEIKIPLQNVSVYAIATIESSLLGAGREAEIPSDILTDLVHIYSFDVDFQRDIRSGDDFEVLYESLVSETGEVVHYGNVLYARLSLSGTPLRLYRFESADGAIDYYNEKSESVRKALMKTPIDGARLSSTFGPRRHPVLGYTRMHQGADFAAPTGTPIFAAGDGVIELAGTNGGYGRYVRIRHNGSYNTSYAHMSRIADGVSAGVRVRQGQIIGYVGTSGVSTGPHLHYEVHFNGEKVNPLGLKLPTGKTLEGSELAAFQSERQVIDHQVAGMPKVATLANN